MTEESEALAAFVRRLADGDPAGANGVVEELWRRTRSDFHKALCKVALAFVQVERGQLAGAAKFLAQARDLLAADPSRDEGVDLSGLRSGLGLALAALEGGSPRVPEDARRMIAQALPTPH